eukprot:CAMPEP_0113324212 /NCGR_PEP_ID=MMETSP0010_2-20120614/16880_1 /TAXON_ID=216773 ORGANISM="Corethron hystrix, Strain 308" /NCGR_SAMPLE_ID=MMETSP0010_2 /ASSEMBLY_ACC=CAM_ASM_000155 /LENGTH=200 /DNA_ID=CAMNT_0000183487 /DNA_START=177 /DNA_END=779 /DNA_ORIENTATION=+ /assembly_acc=CAM_ASM_000155
MAFSSAAADRNPLAESRSPTLPKQQQQFFGLFRIPDEHIFYRSPSSLTVAFVNLRPIVPGHVLVCPQRSVDTVRLSDLTEEEYDDLWRSVRIVQKAIENFHGCGSSNVAVQDGAGAGQSVPHVHVHVLPRKAGDFDRNDEVYDLLQEWAPTDRLAAVKKERVEGLEVPEDGERVDRTAEVMAQEAEDYKSLITRTASDNS